MTYERKSMGRDDKRFSLNSKITKQKVITQVKSTVNLLFWQIGKRINDEILNNKRADYGKQIISNLAALLSAEYDSSFEKKHTKNVAVRRMFPWKEDCRSTGTTIVDNYIIL